jgi:hypothetical protein
MTWRWTAQQSIEGIQSRGKYVLATGRRVLAQDGMNLALEAALYCCARPVGAWWARLVSPVPDACCCYNKKQASEALSVVPLRQPLANEFSQECCRLHLSCSLWVGLGVITCSLCHAPTCGTQYVTRQALHTFFLVGSHASIGSVPMKQQLCSLLTTYYIDGACMLSWHDWGSAFGRPSGHGDEIGLCYYCSVLSSCRPRHMLKAVHVSRWRLVVLVYYPVAQTVSEAVALAG